MYESNTRIKFTSHALKIWESVLAERVTNLTSIVWNRCGFTNGLNTAGKISAAKETPTLRFRT